MCVHVHGENGIPVVGDHLSLTQIAESGGLMQEGPRSTGDPIKAAQYVRMSTDYQQYSIENQLRIISQYAEHHNMQIVRTYSDAGKSGLTTSRRNALLELIADVQARCAPYTAILVYDVSRWGRFQDIDESAYYEYICKRAKIQVHYCAEQFANDGTVLSALMKSIKRTMAGEYSRELSAKVFAGQRHLAELGFHIGGTAGYGLRRQLIDCKGNVKGLLGPGERKNIQNDRVILVPGPENEVTTVREIYRQCTEELKTDAAIAEWLNAQGIPSAVGGRWHKGLVRRILTNPRYVGHIVYNRYSFKLHQKRIRNSRDQWIMSQNAVLPIISKEQFAKAAEIREKYCRWKDEELLEKLRGILAVHGRISTSLLRGTGIGCTKLLKRRFGTLTRTYQLCGYEPKRGYAFIERLLMLRAFHSRECALLVDRLLENGLRVSQDPENGILTINNELKVCVMIVPCYRTIHGGSGWPWRLRNDRGDQWDVKVGIRLAPGNNQVLDYHVYPRAERWISTHIAKGRNHSHAFYRSESLEILVNMAKRVPLAEVTRTKQ